MNTAVDKRAWMQGCGADLATIRQESPQAEAVRGADAAHVALETGEQVPEEGGVRRQLRSHGVVRVAVSYDPARLDHPVEQLFERFKVVIRAGGLVWHSLRVEKPKRGMQS